MAARRQASDVWEEEKSVGESASIADAFAARNHTWEQKEKHEEKGKDDESLDLPISRHWWRGLILLQCFVGGLHVCGHCTWVTILINAIDKKSGSVLTTGA